MSNLREKLKPHDAERYEAIVKALSRDPLMERAEMEVMLGCNYVTIFKTVTKAGADLKALRRQAVAQILFRLDAVEQQLALTTGEPQTEALPPLPPRYTTPKAKTLTCAYFIGRFRAYCGKPIVRGHYCAEHDHKVNHPALTRHEYDRSLRLKLGRR